MRDNLKDTAKLFKSSFSLQTFFFSVSVTGSQLCAAHSQLTQYKDKYGARLKVPNPVPVLGIRIGQIGALVRIRISGI
jgi:hypothetical protein